MRWISFPDASFCIDCDFAGVILVLIPNSPKMAQLVNPFHSLFFKATQVLQQSVEFVDDLPVQFSDVVVGHFVDSFLHERGGHVAKDVASASQRAIDSRPVDLFGFEMHSVDLVPSFGVLREVSVQKHVAETIVDTLQQHPHLTSHVVLNVAPAIADS